MNESLGEMMSSNFQLRIKTRMNSLSVTDKKIAGYLQNHMDEATTLTIHELSKNMNTSSASLSRFAKRLGYSNLQEMKMSIAQTFSKDIFDELTPSDSLMNIAGRVFQANIESIKDTLSLMTEEKLRSVENIITKADKVLFAGLGGSNIVAFDAYHKFLRTPMHTVFQTEFHLQLMEASKLTEKDCAIIISHSGRNGDTIKLAQILKEKKVPMIIITSFTDTPLQEFSTVALISTSEETAHRTEALSAILSQMSIIDTIYVIYAIETKANLQGSLQDIRRAIKTTRV
ncbi:MAG: MurR/RpiR family transcriptional regulator [Clostridiales Family XIII bacterium]|nr:MurR/RpiR family transcriptional regulator [Clostridiales Family XIII bacterium]